MASPLRIGSVPYLVARPLDLGLAALEKRVPALLIEGLRTGELDVALVSSVELFRKPDYRYIDGLAVAGDGLVSSVQVFLRKPIEAVQSIAMDPASRAAAALTRVVLKEKLGRLPEFVELKLGQDPRAAQADAWLRIGDEALRECYEPNPHPSFNPSQAWSASTGLPFVFAAWIIGPAANLESEQSRRAFVSSRQLGRSRQAALAEQAAREWSIPEAGAKRYLLEECRYDLSTDLMRKALFTFRDRAAALDLCRADLEPAACDPHQSCLG